MAAPYRLYGAELSPYSLKVRAYLRFKGIEHSWIPRTGARAAEVRRFAKLPLLPLLVGADDYSLQDTTPMLESLERRYPEPKATPADQGLVFLCALIEDYADEWLNKAVLRYRWGHAEDAEAAALAIADLALEGEADGGDRRADLAAETRARMEARIAPLFDAEGGALIEASYRRLLAALEPVVAPRGFLFGETPTIADFALYGQLAQLARDPTPAAVLRAEAPAVAAYVARLDQAWAGPAEPAGDFEAAVEALTPLIEGEIAQSYLPWLSANAEAVRAGEAAVEVEVLGGRLRTAAQRYSAKALQDLRKKRAFSSDHAGLAALLDRAGCDAWLKPPAGPAEPEEPGEAEDEAESETEASETAAAEE